MAENERRPSQSTKFAWPTHPSLKEKMSAQKTFEYNRILFFTTTEVNGATVTKWTGQGRALNRRFIHREGTTRGKKTHPGERIKGGKARTEKEKEWLFVSHTTQKKKERKANSKGFLGRQETPAI